mmetsp:Transcript_22265/g.39652  ORF Transcript_22265/g.39652 Transcript_22265/m.39652 type:complete len:115 (-) Transcript_22265:56-400(-)
MGPSMCSGESCGGVWVRKEEAAKVVFVKPDKFNAILVSFAKIIVRGAGRAWQSIFFNYQRFASSQYQEKRVFDVCLYDWKHGLEHKLANWNRHNHLTSLLQHFIQIRHDPQLLS